MTLAVSDNELSAAQFREVRDLVYRICGIDLQDGKEGLVRTRLLRRQRELKMASLDEYLDFLRREGESGELAAMVDAMTTNKTSFFRESAHFDYLRKEVLPTAGDTLRFWSAGCSTGEEPYTLAMVLHDELPDLARRDVRILATDISARVLDRAKQGVYTEEVLRDVPPALRHRFTTASGQRGAKQFRVNDSLRSLIRFARLNLMDAWPMQGRFDVILCRNVMIYFDRPTQQKLVRRFSALIRPGGHLFVGHSESLQAISHDLKYVRPATYRKPLA